MSDDLVQLRGHIDVLANLVGTVIALHPAKEAIVRAMEGMAAAGSQEHQDATGEKKAYLEGSLRALSRVAVITGVILHEG